MQCLLWLLVNNWSFRKLIGIELQRVRRLCATRVSAREPETDMKQFARRSDRIDIAHRLMTMHSQIPEVLDHANLGQQRRADGLAKRCLEDARAETLAIGKLQSGVIFVHPKNSQFQSASRVKTRCARVRQGERFRALGGLEQVGPLRREKIEVTCTHRLREILLQMLWRGQPSYLQPTVECYAAVTRSHQSYQTL